jgi:hypothetical protein
MAEYDSPWKEVIDHKLPLLLALLALDVEEEYDWTLDYYSLEQELRKMMPAGETGKRLADKLFRARTRSGDERYMLVEVQGQPQLQFERRAFVYHYRGDDRFGLPVEMIVILADDDPDWRPTTYEVKLKRTQLTFRFNPIKILDWAGRTEELLNHANPVALFIVAHLKSRETRNDDAERSRVKLDLILRLHARKLDAEELRLWYRLLDWLLPLPRDREIGLWQEIARLEQEAKMPFVPYGERLGLEKGLLKGIEVGLDLKFGSDGLALLPEVRKHTDYTVLEAVLGAIKSATSVDDIRQVLSEKVPVDGNGSWT